MSPRKRIKNGADMLYDREKNGGRLLQNNEQVNEVVFGNLMYMNIFTELCMNRFKWEGLPKRATTRFLEKQLFNHGLAVFHDDPTIGRAVFAASPVGQRNVFDDPIRYLLYGNLFQDKRVSAKDCVPIWANYTRTTDLMIVQRYASRLAELDRTIDVNSDNSRTTKVLAYDENSRLSVENLNRQISAGDGVVRVTKPMGGTIADAIAVLDLGVNVDGIEKLQIVRNGVYNEAMGFLGIENSNQDKKERLVAAEVTANNDQTSMMRYVNLNARRQAATEINEKYGLNVSVRYYTDEERATLMGNTEEETEEEGTDA